MSFDSKSSIERLASYRHVVDIIRFNRDSIWRNPFVTWRILYREGIEVIAGGGYTPCRIYLTGIVYFSATISAPGISYVSVFGHLPARQLYLPYCEV